jgi:hypothetical protein
MHSHALHSSYPKGVLRIDCVLWPITHPLPTRVHTERLNEFRMPPHSLLSPSHRAGPSLPTLCWRRSGQVASHDERLVLPAPWPSCSCTRSHMNDVRIVRVMACQLHSLFLACCSLTPLLSASSVCLQPCFSPGASMTEGSTHSHQRAVSSRCEPRNSLPPTCCIATKLCTLRSLPRALLTLALAQTRTLELRASMPCCRSSPHRLQSTLKTLSHHRTRCLALTRNLPTPHTHWRPHHRTRCLALTRNLSTPHTHWRPHTLTCLDV